MEKAKAFNLAYKLAEKAIETGALNTKGLYSGSAQNVAEFIETLAKYFEAVEAPPGVVQVSGS